MFDKAFEVVIDGSGNCRLGSSSIDGIVTGVSEIILGIKGTLITGGLRG
jgi:hypothetical protein